MARVCSSAFRRKRTSANLPPEGGTTNPIVVLSVRRLKRFAVGTAGATRARSPSHANRAWPAVGRRSGQEPSREVSWSHESDSLSPSPPPRGGSEPSRAGGARRFARLQAASAGTLGKRRRPDLGFHAPKRPCGFAGFSTRGAPRGFAIVARRSRTDDVRAESHAMALVALTIARAGPLVPVSIYPMTNIRPDFRPAQRAVVICPAIPAR